MNTNLSKKNVSQRQSEGLKNGMSAFERRSTRHNKKIRPISEEITGYYQRLVEEHHKSFQKNNYQGN